MKTVLEKIDSYRYRIPKTGNMNVEGIIYSSVPLIEAMEGDESPAQVANVATLDGIVRYSLAMPDIHWGYGFPIGGVAAFDVEEGVISPGGVGYDINCGVRVIRTGLEIEETKPRLRELLYTLKSKIPSGVGSKGKIKLSKEDEKNVLKEGAKWAVANGFGNSSDLEKIEDNGSVPGADPEEVSSRALERGKDQLGTLGSGNHFVEVGYVDEIYLEKEAKIMGLFKGGITIIIHTGSRGLGHQVCDDYIAVMNDYIRKNKITLPDRQLANAPIKSKEGVRYLKAMRSAMNFAWANRQIITYLTRVSFEEHFKASPKSLAMDLVYDVSHNTAKEETFLVDGKKKKLLVLRKGATRAYGPGFDIIPEIYRGIGQPVIVPGDMGRCSYILVGTQKAVDDTFGSTCHGAGRIMSRSQAKKKINAREVVNSLEKEGIFVAADSFATIAEEVPQAYKDVSMVVDVVQGAGISKKVAKFKPLAILKG